MTKARRQTADRKLDLVLLTVGANDIKFSGLVADVMITAGVERVLFKPIRHAPVLSHIVVFIALFAIFNSVAGFTWEYTIKSFPSPFPSEPPFGTRLR